VSDFLLKTVHADGAAWGGFQWPLDEGAEVIAPDWDPTPVCGGGLHGLLNGAGNGSLINWSTDAVWIVAEIPDGETVVDGIVAYTAYRVVDGVLVEVES